MESLRWTGGRTTEGKPWCRMLCGTWSPVACPVTELDPGLNKKRNICLPQLLLRLSLVIQGRLHNSGAPATNIFI